MKRRGFLSKLLTGAAVKPARLRSFLGMLSVLAVPRWSVAGSEGKTQAIGVEAIERDGEAAEADWLARSTGPGVMWAHDFRHDEEFHAFHKGVYMPYAKGVYSYTRPKQNPYHATLVSTPFGRSRAIKSSGYGTYLTQDVPRAAVGEIQTWHVAAPENLFEPWDGEYRILVAAKEYVWLQSRDLANKTITVRREKTSGYPARKTTVGSGPQGRWIRPTACFRAGDNGKDTDDIGIANGSARKVRIFGTGAAAHEAFREGYFGHRSYWDPKHGEAKYKDWRPTTATHNDLRKDAFEGDEFYLQFRAKVSASRVKGFGGKMLYIQNCTSGGNGQVFIHIGRKDESWSDVPADWPYGAHAELLSASTCYDDSTAIFGGRLSMPQGLGKLSSRRAWAGDESEPGWFQHPESFPDARYRGPKNRVIGWHTPLDKWVTYLVHIKVGRDSVVQYAHSRLTAATTELTWREKPIEVLHLEDVSEFPDVGYPYYVHSLKRPEGSGTMHENMLVQSIDRRRNTLTVERNSLREFAGDNSSSRGLLGWSRGAVIAYGPYVDFPYRRGRVSWPYRTGRDKRLQLRETTFELFVAVEGDSSYTKIMSGDDYAWLYGDEKAGYLRYLYNPPGLNSIELSQYMNDYVGSGAVAPPPLNHDIQYTQAILSRNFVEVPRV